MDASSFAARCAGCVIQSATQTDELNFVEVHGKAHHPQGGVPMYRAYGDAGESGNQYMYEAYNINVTVGGEGDMLGYQPNCDFNSEGFIPSLQTVNGWPFFSCGDTIYATDWTTGIPQGPYLSTQLPCNVSSNAFTAEPALAAAVCGETGYVFVTNASLFGDNGVVWATNFDTKGAGDRTLVRFVELGEPGQVGLLLYNDYFMTMYNATSGAVLWRQGLPGPGLVYGPVVVGSTVVHAELSTAEFSPVMMYGADATTGPEWHTALRVTGWSWRVQLAGTSGSSPAVVAAFVTAKFAPSTGIVQAFHASSGAPAWSDTANTATYSVLPKLMETTVELASGEQQLVLCRNDGPTPNCTGLYAQHGGSSSWAVTSTVPGHSISVVGNWYYPGYLFWNVYQNLTNAYPSNVMYAARLEAPTPAPAPTPATALYTECSASTQCSGSSCVNMTAIGGCNNNGTQYECEMGGRALRISTFTTPDCTGPAQTVEALLLDVCTIGADDQTSRELLSCQ